MPTTDGGSPHLLDALFDETIADGERVIVVKGALFSEWNQGAGKRTISRKLRIHEIDVLRIELNIETREYRDVAVVQGYFQEDDRTIRYVCNDEGQAQRLYATISEAMLAAGSAIGTPQRANGGNGKVTRAILFQTAPLISTRRCSHGDTRTAARIDR